MNSATQFVAESVASLFPAKRPLHKKNRKAEENQNGASCIGAATEKRETLPIVRCMRHYEVENNDPGIVAFSAKTRNFL